MLQSINIGKVEIKRLEYTDIQNRKTVAFADDRPVGFRINCSAQGMEVNGLLITSSKQLQDFAKLISQAWVEAEKLKPKIKLAPDLNTKPDPCV